MESLEPVAPTLDNLRKKSPTGAEYWMARDLQLPLGYDRWEKFEAVIQKARMACESAGVEPGNHFHETTKMVPIGSGVTRKIQDYYVSRYAAYLIAMNGNPKHQQIAAAQNYFAVQTRRQEIADKFGPDVEKRIELRDRVKDANKHLMDAAKNAGVQGQGYALFYDAGYRGLYGMGLKIIKRRKGITEKDELLDRAGRAELAMNEFRATQTEDMLKRNNVQGETNARNVHQKVGNAVRETVKQLGGTMPEDLPPEQSIKELKKEIKSQKLLPDSKKNEGPAQIGDKD